MTRLVVLLDLFDSVARSSKEFTDTVERKYVSSNRPTMRIDQAKIIVGQLNHLDQRFILSEQSIMLDVTDGTSENNGHALLECVV